MNDLPNWTGIVVRNNLGETGNVPRSASSNSPDIIMAGQTPLEDPSKLTDQNNYSNAYANSLYIGHQNYLYVRGKNFTQDNLAGTWNLFYATPNILLYPYLWQNNQLATSSGNKNPEFSIAAGKIGATLDPFQWVPPDTVDHYCMIAVAITPNHANPIPAINNISDLADYLKNNANIAQRNVQMVRGNLPSLVTTAAYDQGAETATVDLALVISNLPKDSSYTISSGTPIDGKPLIHKDPKTLDNNFKYAWTGLDIPANWNSVFTIEVNFGNDWSGIDASSHPTFEIRGELVMDSAHRLYHLGEDADQHLPLNQRRVDATGGPVRILPVGSVRTICPDIIHK